MKKLFAVDDDAAMLAYLEAVAQSMDYQFTSSGHGFDALRRIEAEQPDAVLLDVMLPDMDGLTLCQQLRSNPSTRHIPVFMLTSLTDSTTVKDAFEYGAQAYLPKPLDRQILKQKLESLN